MLADELAVFLKKRGVIEGVDGMGPEVTVSDVTQASTEAGPTTLFGCVRGKTFDGHDFAPEALAKGSPVLLCERPLDIPIPQMISSNPRKALSLAAAAVHGFPSKKMSLVALTGTNGKSTCAYLARSMLETSGKRCGLIGTIVYSDGESEAKADRTTPDGPTIQRWLAGMAHRGCEHCVMEASSHGIEMYRLAGCEFSAAGFTNLTPEHLDFHQTMERYFETKLRLFTDYMDSSTPIAVNTDDPWGRKLAEMFPKRAITYGTTPQDDPLVSADIHSMTIDGTVLSVFFPDGTCAGEIRSPLVGHYNVSNTLCAAAIGWGMGLDPEVMREGIENLPPVPGRLQKIMFEKGVCCLIDYAHSPDGLEKALSAAKGITREKLWLIFGLGGERYMENRPAMGRIASEGADHLIISMDNPRSEDPSSIARQIESGVDRNACLGCEIIIDRQKAVWRALDEAGPGDVVLIAGKGPETTMILAEGAVHYSDAESVESWSVDRNVPRMESNCETATRVRQN